MNEWNRLQLALDDSGMIESCDCCNALIVNFSWMGNSFVDWSGEILCKKCVDIRSIVC